MVENIRVYVAHCALGVCVCVWTDRRYSNIFLVEDIHTLVMRVVETSILRLLHPSEMGVFFVFCVLRWVGTLVRIVWMQCTEKDI